MAVPRFKFTTADYLTGFTVVSFTGKEQMSALFEYIIELKMSDAIEVNEAALISDDASFIFENPDDSSKNVVVNGILSSFNYLKTATGYYYYEATLVPKAWEDTLGIDFEIFVRMTPRQIIIEEITDAGLEATTSTSSLSTSTSLTSNMQRDFTCQYNESNFSFISRIAEHHGIYYYFDHNHIDGSKLTFADGMNYPPEQPGSLIFNKTPDGDNYFNSIIDFRGVNKQTVQQVIVSGYDPSQPSNKIEGKAGAPQATTGTTRRLTEENFTSTDEAIAIAQIRLEEIQCEATVYEGRSGVVQLTPGHTFRISGHPKYEPDSEGQNPELLVVSLTHEGHNLDSSSASQVRDSTYYSNTFKAIPAEKQFRPKRVTSRPVAISTQGTVYSEASGLRLSERDDEGRYRVKFNFLDDEAKAKASYWLRMSQPTGGTEDGFDIPIKGDVEVKIGFLNGNPDDPHIESVMPNAAFPAHVTANNASNALIATSGLLGLKANGGWYRNVHVHEDDWANRNFGQVPFNFPIIDTSVGDLNKTAMTFRVGEAAMTKEEEMSGAYLVERAYGDVYEYREGDSFRYLDRETEYVIGTSYLEVHAKDANNKVIDYENIQNKGPNAPTTLGYYDFGDKIRTPEGVSIYAGATHIPRGIVEKTWGDKFEYHKGTVHTWSDCDEIATAGGTDSLSPNGGGRTINHGQGVTYNYFSEGIKGYIAPSGSEIIGITETAEKFNSLLAENLSTPHLSKTMADLLTEAHSPSGNPFHDITYTEGDTYDNHIGKEVNEHTGFHGEIFDGDTVTLVTGSSAEHFKGDSDWFFSGHHNESIVGATSSQHIGPKSDSFLGVLNENFVGGKILFELSATKEFSSTSDSRANAKEDKITADESKAALKVTETALVKKVDALKYNISSLDFMVITTGRIGLASSAMIAVKAPLYSVNGALIKLG